MTPMHASARTLVSESEFLALPESHDKVELIDGEVIVSPSPTFWHQEVLRRLVHRLSRWADGRPDVTIGQSPLDVRFGRDRILQPEDVANTIVAALELPARALVSELDIRPTNP